VTGVSFLVFTDDLCVKRELELVDPWRNLVLCVVLVMAVASVRFMWEEVKRQRMRNDRYFVANVMMGVSFWEKNKIQNSK